MAGLRGKSNILYVKTYRQEFSNSLNYITSSKKDLGEALALSKLSSETSLLDSIGEVYPDLVEIGERIEKFANNLNIEYEDYSKKTLQINTIYSAIADGIDQTEANFRENLGKIDQNSLSSSTRQAYEKYMNNELTMEEFLNTHTDELTAVFQKQGINFLQSMTKSSVKQLVTNYVEEGSMKTLLLYGTAISKDAINLNAKGEIVTAAGIIADKLAKPSTIASNSDIFSESALNNLGDSYVSNGSAVSKFLSNSLNKYLVLGAISFALDVSGDVITGEGSLKERFANANYVDAASSSAISVASSIVGGAMEEALAGTAVAGLAGGAVTVAAAGSLTIAYEGSKYFVGGVPREFKPIEYKDVVKTMEKKDLIVENSNESLNRTFNASGAPKSTNQIEAELLNKGYPEEAVDIIISTAKGNESGIQKYDSAGNWTPEFQAINDYYTVTREHSGFTDDRLRELYTRSSGSIELASDPERFEQYVTKMHSLEENYNNSSDKVSADRFIFVTGECLTYGDIF